jgi:NAD-dependent deacetylase
MLAIITQNIDGLHQASGVPDAKVIELHGNSTYATCLDCRRRYELDWVRESFAVDERLPLCTSCGGMIKTATISFGQAMPEAEMERAHEATLAADLFIVLGSSLVVYPAAGFPILAKRNGARLVIINREPTEQDEFADLVINAEIGSTMSRAIGVN